MFICNQFSVGMIFIGKSSYTDNILSGRCFAWDALSWIVCGAFTTDAEDVATCHHTE